MAQKLLKDLNLLDRFLFNEVVEDSENIKTILDIILAQDTKLKEPPQTEKEIRTLPDNRQVRLDVYVMDEEDTVYNTEVQKKNTKNLPRRSRFYQGVIDSNLLPPGSIDFNAMQNTFIILITPFDLFGLGFYQYTFRMKCEEASEVELEDGATRIFLNCHGRHPEMVSSELVELLHYMEESTDEVASQCSSERIRGLHEKVHQIKSNNQMEAKYMQEWEEKVMERQEAFEAGKMEGEAVGRAEGEAVGRAEGESVGKALGEERMGKLMERLLESGRTEDMKKALADAEHRKKLYEEFSI